MVFGKRGCQTKDNSLFKGTALEIPKIYLREEVKNAERTRREETKITIVYMRPTAGQN